VTDDETWVDAEHANTLNQFDAGDTRTTHAVVEQTSTLQAGGGERGNRLDAEMAAGGQLVAQAYSIREDAKADTFSATEIDAARCLQKHQPSVQSHHAQTFIAETYPINDGRDIHKDMNGTGIGEDGAPAYTLDRQQHASVVQVGQQEVAGTLDAHYYKGPGSRQGGEREYISELDNNRMTVRRLTPVECERLMGWPDGFTAPDGVKAPDSKRYAACGDGIVAPVAFWIADRIRMIEEEEGI
jgi:site-specific DNA-cytosine methylase